ncbi:hypothetical protein BHE74_00022300 [Ensete ventricosum]|nr:hypothetical protein BHE74_00022300 [Ensete ventricosum]RZR96799.1 hypothetical protein BHM03_00025862 [Ensete ventricosum]
MRCQFKSPALESLRKQWQFPTRRRPRRGLFRVADGDEISDHQNMLEVQRCQSVGGAGDQDGNSADLKKRVVQVSLEI